MFIALNKAGIANIMVTFLGTAICTEMPFQYLHAASGIRLEIHNSNARPGRDTILGFEECVQQHDCLTVARPARGATHSPTSPPSVIWADRCVCQGFYEIRLQINPHVLVRSATVSETESKVRRGRRVGRQVERFPCRRNLVNRQCRGQPMAIGRQCEIDVITFGNKWRTVTFNPESLAADDR